MEETISHTKTASEKIVADARTRAKLITSAAQENYKMEVNSLLAFTERFSEYAQEIIKSYPSDRTRRTVAVADALKEILIREETPTFTSKDKILEVYDVINRELLQKSVQKNTETESESGFNLDDVLNPKGDLDLMSLCKELGATD